jgi:peptidoglycan-associated lipoprotein
MKNVLVLTTAVGFAFLLLGCAGSKKAAESPEEFYEIWTPERQSEAEKLVETELLETVQEEKAPTAETVETVETVETAEIVTFGNVNFDFDKYNLTVDARAILADHARRLKEHPQMEIMVEGHCDERGTIEYNLALGERRAAAVKIYLINYGIHPSRLHTISYGKEMPLDPQHTEDAWAKNRRAAFQITRK